MTWLLFFLAFLRPCTGDVNGDRVVNILDVSIISSNYLQTVTPGTNGDLNRDGTVDGSDLAIAEANYGNVCPVYYLPGVSRD